MPDTLFPYHLFKEDAPLPPRFQLFGMGHRRKLIYQSGRLADAGSGETLRQWTVQSESFEPAEYRVTLDTTGGPVRLFEDAEGVWMEDGRDRTPLTRNPVRLPRFEGHPHAALLRALHAELLVNVMPFGPVPNLMVYPRPWYRDAALMLMCFAKTGNLELVEPWVMGLNQVFDLNNRGMAEADNPGELLYMISLVSDRRHPLVEKILKEVRPFEKDGHIRGPSDFAEHPVYQTKWMKYGLRSLGLDDPYRIPAEKDIYSNLFWMDYRDEHTPGPRFDIRNTHAYPYLRWAEAHFHGEPAPATPAAGDYPLSWEAQASDAFYPGMRVAGEAFVRARLATPHTWHAAEMFLYFHDMHTGKEVSR